MLNDGDGTTGMKRTGMNASGALLCAALIGCSGVDTRVRADSARYPVSFSSAVATSGGDVLYVGDGLEKVGDVSESHWRWSVPYDAMEGEVDISEDVNASVARAGGEAVVNLSITSTECFLDWFIILNWLPFWPNCAIVSLEGDVVKRSAASGGTPR